MAEKERGFEVRQRSHEIRHRSYIHVHILKEDFKATFKDLNWATRCVAEKGTRPRSHPPAIDVYIYIYILVRRKGVTAIHIYIYILYIYMVPPKGGQRVPWVQHRII